MSSIGPNPSSLGPNRRARLTIRNPASAIRSSIQDDKDQQVLKIVSQLTSLLQDQETTVDQLYQHFQREPSLTEDVKAKLDLNLIGDFFAKRLPQFLQSQQQLAHTPMPQLTRLQFSEEASFPQIKVSKLEERREAAVFEVLDSFNNTMFEKDYQQGLHWLKTLKDMSKNEKYQEYFGQLDVATTFRQYYEAWVDSCKDEDVLLRAGQVVQSMKVFLAARTEAAIGQLGADVEIVSGTNNWISKLVEKLLKHIEKGLTDFKSKYDSYCQQNQHLYSHCSQWLDNIGSEFYDLIRTAIFEDSDDLQTVLSTITRMLSAAAEMEAKGISLVRLLKKLVSQDLAAHVERFIGVILEAFDGLLKDDSTLYAMATFKSLATVSEQLAELRQVNLGDLKTMACSKKAILLVNSYGLLLEPIYNKSWQFLQSRVYTVLCQQTKQLLDSRYNFAEWDYFVIYLFLEDLLKGKLRGKAYESFSPAYQALMQKQLAELSGLSKLAWEKFESQFAKKFYKNVLSSVPRLCWENGKLFSSKQRLPPQPTSLSLILIDECRDFLRQYVQKLTAPQLEYLTFECLQYLIHMLEYVLYTNYHKDGQKESVFLLPQTHRNLYDHIKQMPFRDLSEFQNSQIFKVGYFGPGGLTQFMFDVHFVGYVLGKVIKSERLNPETFLAKLSKIYEKQKNVQIDARKDSYSTTFKNFEGASLQECIKNCKQRSTTRKFTVSRS